MDLPEGESFESSNLQMAHHLLSFPQILIDQYVI